MAMGAGGKIENTKEQLQKMNTAKLVAILESDCHGSCNKQWANEILTVRLVEAATKARDNAFCEG